MNIDKENDVVAFNEEKHKYWIKGSDNHCISVTTLIGKYMQQFDSEFWSRAKALQALVTEMQFNTIAVELYRKKRFDLNYLTRFRVSPEDFEVKRSEILKEWELKNKEACERGTAIHKIHEDLHVAGTTKELQDFNIEGTFKCYIDNKLRLGDRGVYPELLLHRISEDQKLRIAGQADLIIIDNNEVQVLDYKTNKQINKSSYYNKATKTKQMMKYPLSHIQDSNYWHYVLQLSTYGWMIQKIDPKFNIKRLALIHYDHDGKKTIYELPYLKKEVELMLASYKGSLITQEAYEKIKPIEY